MDLRNVPAVTQDRVRLYGLYLRAAAPCLSQVQIESGLIPNKVIL